MTCPTVFNCSGLSRIFIRFIYPKIYNYGFAYYFYYGFNVLCIGFAGMMNLMVVSSVAERVVATIQAKTYERAGKGLGYTIISVYIVWFTCYCVGIISYEQFITMKDTALPDEPCWMYRRPQFYIVLWTVYIGLTVPVLPFMYVLFVYNRNKVTRIVEEDISTRFMYRQNVTTLKYQFVICLSLIPLSLVGVFSDAILVYQFYFTENFKITYATKALMNVSNDVLYDFFVYIFNFIIFDLSFVINNNYLSKFVCYNLQNIFFVFIYNYNFNNCYYFQLPSLTVNLAGLVYSGMWLRLFNPLYMIVRNDLSALGLCKLEQPSNNIWSTENAQVETDVYFDQLLDSWNFQEKK